MELFETSIVGIGSQAKMFAAEAMLILFGQGAPEDLKEYTYQIDVNPVNGDIVEGQFIYFDNQAYRITSVGNLVTKNLNDIGHISVKFNGATEAELPGTLYVEAKTLPEMNVGTRISIK